MHIVFMHIVFKEDAIPGAGVGTVVGVIGSVVVVGDGVGDETGDGVVDETPGPALHCSVLQQ